MIKETIMMNEAVMATEEAFNHAAHLCMGCMEQRGNAQVCPSCGWEEGKPSDSTLSLTPRTRINEQYIVGRVLGYGGFGITYLAWDMNLGIKVALKEYLPSTLASRHPGSQCVTAYNGEARELFDYGLEKFIEEAKSLARFQDHPGVVSVMNFFRANSTGYIVMTYVEGVTLKDYLATNGGKVPFDKACSILMPVMDALRAVHAAGMLHRDISPDNIYLTCSNQVKLLDFGAARYAVGEHSQNLSVILKPGYAPEEQYRSRGNQGPWTDVYALGATMYRAITGEVPPDALDRLEKDEIAPPSRLGATLPHAAETALMKALMVKATARFRDVATFQNAIALETDLIRGWNTRQEELLKAQEALKKARSQTVVWCIGAAFLLVIAIASVIGWAVTSAQVADKLKAGKDKIESLTNDLKKEKAARDSLQERIDNLEKHPARQIAVNSLRLRYTDQNGNFQTSALNSFRRGDVRFVYYDLDVRNNWMGMKDLKGELGVKYFNPDGSLKTGKESRNGFTYVESINISDSAKVIVSWGNKTLSTYQPGRNRIEIWKAGEKVAETYFYIYE